MNRISLTLLLLLIAVGAIVYVACSGEGDSFSYAAPNRTLTFPSDHASHPDYKTEWWYYTGHLRAKDGRRFGFQLTWFRVGLTNQEQEGSKFKAKNFYFAHFTITDKDAANFYSHEKIARGGEYDNAGADTRLLRTFIDDWKVEGLGSMFYLTGRTDSMALSLIATPRKPPVLQGENGYSRKGTDPNNASMYYSMTRLGVVGTLMLNGEPMEVEGEAWMDHEFGTSQLGSDQVGWDWFALQLNNNEEVMVYGLRRADGSYDPNATGAFIMADGSKVPLKLSEYSIDVLERWTSPHSNAVYPSKWRLSIPSQQFQATITPYVADQELRTENSARVTYWEGAVNVEGTRNGAAILGEGYVELTGYAGELKGLR